MLPENNFLYHPRQDLPQTEVERFLGMGAVEVSHLVRPRHLADYDNYIKQKEIFPLESMEFDTDTIHFWDRTGKEIGFYSSKIKMSMVITRKWPGEMKRTQRFYNLLDSSEDIHSRD